MDSNLFYMLLVMLTVLTLMSSFGGGIRYRENFMEELGDITGDMFQQLPEPLPTMPEVVVPPPTEEEAKEEPPKKVPVKLPVVQPSTYDTLYCTV
jgi:hypothetical protein